MVHKKYEQYSDHRVLLKEQVNLDHQLPYAESRHVEEYQA